MHVYYLKYIKAYHSDIVHVMAHKLYFKQILLV